ncbi:MAG TPA: NifU family protein [Streptosporangiaceae bacterium]|nr:NifU family protein [Streptosporangiaceae bacterium]
MTRVQQVGDQIEELLAALTARGQGPLAEELVRLLVGLYGDGLAHIMESVAEDGGPAVLDRLTADPLVENLLLLHGLHPLDVDARIQRALDRVRPYLGSHAGGVHYVGVTDGVARLRLEGNCVGCPSSAVTVQLAIEGAVQDAAPEVSEVVVEGVTEAPATPAPVLLQIGPRPDGAAIDSAAIDRAAMAAPSEVAGGGWVTLPEIGPPSARPVTTTASDLPIVLCSVRGTLYAYRDGCAACGSGLGDGRLDREVLTCPCGAAYDVSRAGRGLGDTTVHLNPLPLVTDSQGIRVAVPAAAVAQGRS